MSEASEEYFEDEDIRQQWHDECLSNIDRRAFTSTSELHESWTLWADRRKYDPGSSTGTSQWLKRQGYRYRKTGSKRGFVGVVVTD